jgi:hypothetical protein
MTRKLRRRHIRVIRTRPHVNVRETRTCDNLYYEKFVCVLTQVLMKFYSLKPILHVSCYESVRYMQKFFRMNFLMDIAGYAFCIHSIDVKYESSASHK